MGPQLRTYDFTSGFVGAWTWDIDQDTVSFESLMGVAPQAARRNLSGFLEMVHPDDRDQVRLDVGRVVRDLSEFESEFRLLLPSGRIVWLASKASVQRDADGKALQVHGISIDITAWKTATAELQRREREFSTIVD